MISRLIIVLGLLALTVDCADLTVTGQAVIGVIVMAFGWWLNQALGRARRHVAAIDELVDELNAEAAP
ncbi:hypothetical protein LJR045_000949 [Microbacterium sp. LjRoot45]|uniref:hypothetical protein n=1 Tax=Microbacterium sp. LjRoot45 TaxID=3342329 RepID=UPI003ED00E24